MVLVQGKGQRPAQSRAKCATYCDAYDPILSSVGLVHRSFVGGRAAYQLDDGTYSVDAGENDIRAIYDAANAELKFFCRYQRDMNFYDKKQMAFASKHSISHTKMSQSQSENSK